MVFRIYVEKKPGFDVEAQQLLAELGFLTTQGLSPLTKLRIINLYDVEGIDEDLFERCVPVVFSEPQVDAVSFELPVEGVLVGKPGSGRGVVATPVNVHVFAVEALPGQFDQRADSAAECVQLVSQGDRPRVRCAKVYVLEGEVSPDALAAIKRYVINPVESRETSLAALETLAAEYPEPAAVEVVEGFTDLDEAGLAQFLADRGLAMDLADLAFCQRYFAEEGRNPTIAEIRMIDTYWSDHCRHTTFGTVLDEVDIADEGVRAAYGRYVEMRRELGRDEKPVCLMDMGTIGAKWLKARGVLQGLDESEEVNACTVKCKVDVDGQEQDWLYLFKNETHNHPTEIEPFGGAATCVGGAIRDPLSGRSYVYQAMRVTGAADPTAPVADTLPGKLPQRKLTTTAAAGYSSYGNQVGLATGQVSELYHPGYAAKRMEIGAVVGATPANHVRRETPAPGDVVVLLGGRTGRDGIGGATGSSKAHKTESLESCGAEVQKGNAPVERKIQRLFRRGEACRLIKRCNDFGAGGVSVAVGELADGLLVNLDKVPKKYEGLDGTELAIAESQERMAVALAAEDVEAFVRLAHEENLEATPIAEVTEEPRVRMTWRGDVIVDVSRAFLASNGAPKRQRVRVPEQGAAANALPRVPGWDAPTLDEGLRTLLADLNVCCNKGLVERFDSTIGAATVLMPFGGERQLTPAQAMVAKFPVDGETTTCSGMAWGFNPYLSEADQFVGAYVAVVESVAKLVGAGFRRADMYLTFQEYFEKLRDEPERWGKPMASVLGALMAQVDLGVGSIGGKDSMSGSFEQLDVPPTLVSFATAVGSVGRVTSPEFKGAGHPVLFVDPGYEPDGATPCKDGLIEAFDLVERLIGDGVALGVSTCGFGGPAEALFKMCVGNGVGVSLAGDALCGPAPAGPAGSEGAADEAARAATAADGAEAAHAAAAAAEGAAEAAEAAGPRRVASLFQHAYGSFVVELAHEVDLPALSSARAQVVGETTAAYAFSACGETLDLASLQEVWESALEDVFPYRSKGSSGLPAGGPADAVAFPSTRSRGDAGDSRTGVRVAPAIPTTSGTGETLADFDGPASGAAAGVDGAVETVSFTGGVPLTYNGRVARPRVVIPVFPGTNCEYDTARAFEAAGAVAEVLVINNLTPEHVAESTQALAQAIGNSQIVMIPGGFSGGDEPDGSAKFITAFFRAPQVTEAVRDLLQNRDGLMLGICNGFQALVKLGLVPFGDIRPMDGECPTLTFNTIGRHQSRLVHTRVASNLSPWLARCEVGDIHTVPVSHGEGRFVAPPALLEEMLANGQVATQYVDARGVPSMDLAVNPNGAVLAIEGITSPDGRVLGKMGHSERRGAGLYKNVPGNQFQPLFEAGVDYFAG